MRTRNLFISHAWSYGDAYTKLCTMLTDAPRFSYRNYSVPKDDPVHNANNVAELYAAIKGKMAFTEVVLILAGVYSTYSKWIQREIKIAKQDFTKPVIAIEPWGSGRTSTIVKQNADLIVKWNTSSIVSAIRDLTP